MSNRKIPVINRAAKSSPSTTTAALSPRSWRQSLESMFCIDAVQREIAASSHVTDATMVTDAFGRKAGSRPGYCYGPTGNSEAQARAAYDTRSKYLADAWRTPTVAASVSDQTSQEKRRKLDDPDPGCVRGP